MALRILQFGVVFAIGYFLGPASPQFAGADTDRPIPLSIELKDPEDTTVVRGQSALLRCDVKSLTSDRIQITWLHNDVPIKSNDSRRYVQNDGSLYFPKVGGGKKNKGLTGEYRCNASTQNGSILSNPSKLRVASFGDFIQQQPTNLSVPESQPAVLFCKINSVPAVEIQWEFNTKPLPHNTRYVPLPKGALLITKTHSSDAGSYRCIATNNILKKTKHSKIVQLTVSSIPVKTVAPTFLPLDILPNITVLVGENVNLYCAVTGWPIPTVQWLNNDSIVISNSSVLQFHNVSLHDTGNYTCVAYNSGGRNILKYTLNVQQKPYFNGTPTSISYPPAKTIRLTCNATGVPKPKIYWLKNGKPLSNEARIKKNANGLIISHTVISDSGIYQCFAANEVGQIWSAAQLTPTSLDAPSPPENVQCRPFDDTSICLSWQSPQNVSVKAYSIYCYYTIMGHDVPGAEFVTNKSQYLAIGLNGSTNYTCYVRLYSKVASDQSEKVTCKTGVRGMRNLQVIPVNETSVELTWSKVSTDVPCNGTKYFYRVQWKRKGRTYSDHTEDFSHVISGLSPSVEYEFRVVPAWIKNDISQWISFTPKGDNSRRTNISNIKPFPPDQLEAGTISTTSINLTWIDNNENTRFYSVCMTLTETETHDCNEKDLLKSASTSLFISDLQPDSLYDFKVRAHSYDGFYGPFSKTTTIRTHADVPSKVLNLNYDIVNDTSVCLHWRTPLHKNGKLTGYLILYTPNANWPLDEWFNKSVPMNAQNKGKSCRSGPNDDQRFSSLLTGLLPDQQYTVYVRAASEVGLGNPNYPIKISTIDIKTTEQPELLDDVHYNQNLGIIMGITISLLSLICCVVSTILVRKRCLKSRAFTRARMAASNNYYPAVAQYASEGTSVQVRLEHPCAANIHEIEHLVSEDCTNHIPPDTPAHLDTKGSDGFPNGHINGSAKPYINGHIPNGIVHITENPRYYALECNGHINDKKPNSQDNTPYEEDSNSNLKTSKFQDLHRIFENSKITTIKTPTECNVQSKKKSKANSNKTSSFKGVRPNG